MKNANAVEHDVRGIFGYGLYFNPQLNGSAVIWAKLAGYAKIEIDCGDDFETVAEDHVDEIEAALDDEGFTWNVCGLPNDRHYLITRGAVFKSETDKQLSITAVEMEAAARDGIDDLRSLAAQLGLPHSELKWHLSTWWE